MDSSLMTNLLMPVYPRTRFDSGTSALGQHHITGIKRRSMSVNHEARVLLRGEAAHSPLKNVNEENRLFVYTGRI